MQKAFGLLIAAAILASISPASATAQTFPVDDPVLQGMWREGMEMSQAHELAQALLDSIGPRLTGSPAHKAANEWAVARLQSWGIDARNEQYGTWMSWERGITHIDLVEPRVRSLEGTMLAWSPATKKKKVGVVVLPDATDSAAFAAQLSTVKGKLVLTSFPEPTCRPDEDWEEYATPESIERMKTERDTARAEWNARIERTGFSDRALPRQLEAAGAAGILTSSWPGAWGVYRVFNARTDEVPTFGLSCEDYGLVFRLAESGQNPVLEIEAKSRFLGEGPVFNTVAEIRGSERPDEYVLLSAHFDSWDGGSGATDNGTGSVTMLEAMRILKATYPNPKRTILLGLWGGEEQGLIGSRSFAESHPEVVEGLQALLNQDNGTGRITRMPASGLLEAGEYFGRWLSHLPAEISQHIELTIPGTPGGGGSDHASFICAGAPAFFLFALNWSYFPYTWHTNRDTYDKIVFDDLKNNATLVAMLAYLASEEPQQIPRDRRVLPISRRTGEQMTWPECRTPRTWEEYKNP
jgi:carboxypeptidase Q